MRRIGWAIGAASLVACAWAAPAAADIVTPDGQAIAYSTMESHAPGDTDGNFDTYLWNRGALELGTPGPDTTGRGSTPAFLSADGTRLLFVTDNAMTPDDRDTTYDVYEYHAGVVRLVSTGPTDTGQTGGAGIQFGGASSDGTRVFFVTDARLVAADTDDAQDVYLRTTDGVTTLVSTSPSGIGGGYHVLAGVSRDGLRVLEVTDEPLVAQDRDTAPDVYERVGSTVTLVSQGSAVDDTPDADGAWPVNVTPDARSVVFQTKDQLTAGDQNDDVDLYQRSRGRTLLVSARADGVSPDCGPDVLPSEPRAPAPCTPEVLGQSDDGGKILFRTDKPLAEGPEPHGLPVTVMRGGLLERTATGTRWLDGSPGYHTAIAADGSRYIIETSARRAAGDTDDTADLYSLAGGQWTLLTRGTEEGVTGAMLSRDARRAYFQTSESLVPADADGGEDTYVSSGGAPALASTGPADVASTDAFTGALGISADGSRFFFSSMKPMVAGDTDDARDLYLRTNGQTSLLTP